MLVKIVTLSFQSVIGGFDDTELRSFIKDKEVIAIRDHLFMRNEIPYLILIVKYFALRIESEAMPKSAESKNTDGSKREESWRKLLSEADFGLFNLLREWRSKQCQKEGVPPYILFTNKQLAEITKLRPQEMSELAKIEGIGKAKIENMGLMF